MLATRGGLASIKSISTFSAASIYLIPQGLKFSKLPFLSSGIALNSRAFQTLPLWKQQATASAVIDTPAIEETATSQANASAVSQRDTNANHGPITKFKELAERGLVCQTVVDTLTKDMGLETMTEVQSKTINETLKGIDVLAQARTGTGKTLAFLIPIFQNIVSKSPELQKPASRFGRGARVGADIRAIIISPTRELAEQIAVEARKVVRNTGILVQTAVGGTLKKQGLQRIRYSGCHVLIGTPGRLNDILSDPYSQVRAPNLSALVLDEADRLLDQGFAPEIQSIQDLLPNRRDVDRQTLLFSATIPREVLQVVRKTMKPDYKFIRTVKEGEQQTHMKVPQKVVRLNGFENQVPALVELCLGELQNPTRESPFKAIVFFNATADVCLTAAVLRQLQPRTQPTIPHSTLIIEMHARLGQNQRTRAAESFRNAKSAIMLSSDVTARGMDFPNVTHVIQIGLPTNEEQYVHRIGRTARGDKAGEGWLLVTSMEAAEARRKLSHMPLVQDTSLKTAQIDMAEEGQLPEVTARILTNVTQCTSVVPRELKVNSYMASLGIYSWFPNKQILIDALNARSRYGWSMDAPPPVKIGLAKKLGLSRVSGLVTARSSREESSIDDHGGFQDERPGVYSSRGFDRARDRNRFDSRRDRVVQSRPRDRYTQRYR